MLVDVYFSDATKTWQVGQHEYDCPSGEFMEGEVTPYSQHFVIPCSVGFFPTPSPEAFRATHWCQWEIDIAEEPNYGYYQC